MQQSANFPRNSTHPNLVFRSPTRISITVPFNTYQELIKRSDDEGRSMSNLAAFILESMLRQENH